MTEHKFTDGEIIRALECCANSKSISDCACCFYSECVSTLGCVGEMMKDTLDLINRQKAEIERIHRHTEMYHELKAEAIKEFAERVIDLIYAADDVNPLSESQIDNLVKEMTEEKTKI